MKFSALNSNNIKIFLLKITLLIVTIVAITFSFLRDSFIISDEAVNLQMVKNMKYSEEFIDRPSYNPGGELN